MSRTPHRTATQRHHTLRNPWLDGAPLQATLASAQDARPASRSSGSTTYDGYIPIDGPYQGPFAPEPPPPWQFTHGPMRTTPAPTQSPVYEVPPSDTLPRRGPGPVPIPSPGPLPGHQTVGRQSYATSSERPLTPGGMTQASNLSGTGSCGGCDALDTWCYYCVQAVLGVAALAGVSLLIAAGVLRAQPPRAAATANLSALPYIGAMLAAVSGALLIVQKCARNEKKRKKRQQLQRAGTAGTLRRQAGGGQATFVAGQSAPGPGGTVGGPGDLIPLQELHMKPTSKHPKQGAPALHQAHPIHLQHQFQPLLARPNQSLRLGEIPLSPSGTPWWRRQPTYPGRAVHPS